MSGAASRWHRLLGFGDKRRGASRGWRQFVSNRLPAAQLASSGASRFCPPLTDEFLHLQGPLQGRWRISTNLKHCHTLQSVKQQSAPALRECGGFVGRGPEDDAGVLEYAEGARREKPAKTPRALSPNPKSEPGLRECGGFVRLGPDGDAGVLQYAEGAGREKRAKTPRYRKPGGVPNGTRTRVAALKGRSPRPLDDGDALGKRREYCAKLPFPPASGRGSLNH